MKVTGAEPATGEQTRLKVLIQQRHWQTYRTFCHEYDRAAGTVDRRLVGRWPSRAQLHRWLSGSVKKMPYPDHCRVLEAMFPEWSAEQLFEPWGPEVNDSAVTSSAAETAADEGLTAQGLRIHLDLTEEDNRSVAQRIRAARSIFFAAHTGYNAMVSQYQSAVRDAVIQGATLRVVVSDPEGPLMKERELTRRLCPSIRQSGEIDDVLYACARHRSRAVQHRFAAEQVQARTYPGPPSLNILLVDGWLRLIHYLPLVDAADSPVYEYEFDPDEPTPLIRKYLAAVEQLWAGSDDVDLDHLAKELTA
ncbi:hypothetical protein [Micromonospora sp. MH99]|uniref:hypothetical protein n=1 Tax=Micromonospora sp. MH99 TaxID=1945510 RepID=UPI001F1D0CB0|nr:hypothetical protein [Micromonospora sp. MH99]MCF0092094.1 hypothetical protein [Micromonospora sp. MH99]